MACLQMRFSNKVVAGQRCVGRLLQPCWQQRSGVRRDLKAELLNRGFSRDPGRVVEPHEESRAFARDSSRAFFSGPRSPGAWLGILSLVAAMDAVLLLRAARPWLTARDQRAARTTTPAVNAGDAQ